MPTEVYFKPWAHSMTQRRQRLMAAKVLPVESIKLTKQVLRCSLFDPLFTTSSLIGISQDPWRGESHAARSQEHLYDLIFCHLMQGMLLLDASWDILTCSPLVDELQCEWQESNRWPNEKEGVTERRTRAMGGKTRGRSWSQMIVIVNDGWLCVIG